MLSMPITFRLDLGKQPVRNDDSTPDVPCAPTKIHLPWPGAKTPTRLHHFFERSCDALPGNLALVVGDQRLTYAALDARANRLAHHLVRRGLRPGACAGLLLERSVPPSTALLPALNCPAAF